MTVANYVSLDDVQELGFATVDLGSNLSNARMWPDGAWRRYWVPLHAKPPL